MDMCGQMTERVPPLLRRAEMQPVLHAIKEAQAGLPVSEPATMMLLGTGLAAIGGRVQLSRFCVIIILNSVYICLSEVHNLIVFSFWETFYCARARDEHL